VKEACFGPGKKQGGFFLTGGSGFVGLALLERLLGERRTVVKFDRCIAPDALRPRLTELPGHLSLLVASLTARA
jgi:nucleoside-diphosphate-sugar epimerase